MRENTYSITFTHICESSFEDLYILESLIKITKESCLDKEISASYYNLDKNEQISLSQERNNYINMLSLALEKIQDLKQIQSSLELIYK